MVISDYKVFELKTKKKNHGVANVHFKNIFHFCEFCCKVGKEYSSFVPC